MTEWSDPVTVTTRHGTVVGARHGDVSVFRGIPYAAPPVGPLRWRPPAPVEPWDGPRPATSFAPAPLQSQPPSSSLMFHTNFADRRALVMSEDCLYLNVWSPDPSASAGLPVMVWIHGGGNRYGHGGQEIHDGASMASRGVVVVSLNMRLGGLGFLALPGLADEDDLGASGNYALLDVVAALRWVHTTIGAFGGDPDAVTLAGNSAGAAIINHLMAAPDARGLFRSVIGQSAAGMFRAEGPMPDQAAAQEAGRRAIAALPTTDVERLRTLPGTAFLLATQLGVVVDGRLLTRDTQDVFLAGDQTHVPLLAGFNTDEGSIYTVHEDAAALRARVAKHPALDAVYPVDDATVAESARRFVGETRFSYPVWRWASTHVQTSGAPTWLYVFEQQPPLPPDVVIDPPADGGPGFGVHHTAELAYTTDNLGARDWPWTARDRELATTIADAWARFIATGDPRGGPIQHWTPFDASSQARALVLGASTREATVGRIDALLALDDLPRPL